MLIQSTTSAAPCIMSDPCTYMLLCLDLPQSASICLNLPQSASICLDRLHLVGLATPAHPLLRPAECTLSCTAPPPPTPTPGPILTCFSASLVCTSLGLAAPAHPLIRPQVECTLPCTAPPGPILTCFSASIVCTSLGLPPQHTSSFMGYSITRGRLLLGARPSITAVRVIAGPPPYQPCSSDHESDVTCAQDGVCRTGTVFEVVGGARWCWMAVQCRGGWICMAGLQDVEAVLEVV